MSIDVIVVLCALTAGGLLLWRKLAGNRLWRASTTPLASIIGSGFLVLGPLLSHSYGRWAPAVMAMLCLAAYAFGWVVRVNIAAIDAQQRSPMQERWDDVSSWVLVVAYVISVAYYLNLFGAFGLNLFLPNSEMGPKLLTSAAYVLIAVVGLTKGFGALELMERFSVGLKLAIIAGLLGGLAVFFAQRGVAHEWVFSPPSVHGISALTLAFGLIVTVQGFETSRYLGLAYDASTRIQSMRVAQWLSAFIYMVYVVLLTYSFAGDAVPHSETAIIDLMRKVAWILPPLLVGAALSAQFSAAVADTSGSGGLVRELSGGRVPERRAYVVLAVVGLALTWMLHVFEIIALASRAFALYYAIQAAIATLALKQQRRPIAMLGAASLSLTGLLIAVFGRAIEGG
ncbi:hypothetical protein [Hydrogenophaga sp. PAMC20947]|uniref:hypothetical protein n=1 Tax=Hydrogenophaga sp. PAMC20947 TaxID=2565558 RepID=UPI00109DCF4D|nr:hypothetical protein [Hydrogenophaga sp. PAMC20947]QCB44584.1 hypothetical protein E5678_00130 [Hydrogenophaga sp. PAMC20947]